MKTYQALIIIRWLLSDSTGMSAKAICRFMLGIEPDGYYHYPHDKSDRSRCIRLLNLIPEWWDRLDELVTLPKQTVIMFGKNGIENKTEGWEEQIPLIRAEAQQTKQKEKSE